MYNRSNLLCLRFEQPTEGNREEGNMLQPHALSFSRFMPRIARSVPRIVGVKIALSTRPTINVCRIISIALALHKEDVTYILKFLYSTICSSNSAGSGLGGQ